MPSAKLQEPYVEAAAEVEEREEVEEEVVDCLEVEAGLEVAKERQAKEC